MALSIFLAKWFGLYMLIFAAIWLLRKDQISDSVRHFISSKGLIFFSGLMNLLFGLAIAIAHPIWELNWRGLITILGYLMIYKGIMRLLVPETEQRQIQMILDKGYWPLIIFLVVLGGFLTYSGFATR